MKQTGVRSMIETAHICNTDNGQILESFPSFQIAVAAFNKNYVGVRDVAKLAVMAASEWERTMNWMRVN